MSIYSVVKLIAEDLEPAQMLKLDLYLNGTLNQSVYSSENGIVIIN